MNKLCSEIASPHVVGGTERGKMGEGRWPEGPEARRERGKGRWPEGLEVGR